MKLTIESVNDESLGLCFHYYGDADNEGLHSFTGLEGSLNAAFEAARECIRTELNHFGLLSEWVVIDAPPPIELDKERG